MKKKHNYNDYDKWFEEYKPKLNHFKNDENESWNGCLYETYGEEDEYVTQEARKYCYNVWTLLEWDGVFIVTNGWHYVNRIGYFFTEKPWKEGDDFNIVDRDDIKKILRRERYLTTGK